MKPTPPGSRTLVISERPHSAVEPRSPFEAWAQRRRRQPGLTATSRTRPRPGEDPKSPAHSEPGRNARSTVAAATSGQRLLAHRPDPGPATRQERPVQVHG